ncbi:hypothetical protein [Streptomyces sp. NBC_01497]|uniref:hypothetical protein n=1 Tax=Streptomyces sp. NBC_01497 TaxID=2903885 RepID=UPI002E2EC20C|nr:hypothetical protein [Streptomyces sp. NBC_01497]
MKMKDSVVAMAAILIAAAGNSPAQAASVHYIKSTVVTAESSSGHGCEAWLQWTGTRAKPSVRTRGESWGHHCLVDLYRKGHQYHSWHLDYEGDVSSAHRMYTGITWMPDHGYQARACLVTDSGRRYCGKPW